MAPMTAMARPLARPALALGLLLVLALAAAALVAVLLIETLYGESAHRTGAPLFQRDLTASLRCSAPLSGGPPSSAGPRLAVFQSAAPADGATPARPR